MSEKRIRVVKHGFYKVSNRDLNIKNRSGEIMGGFHHVVVLTKQSKDGFVKVKTITSLENISSNGVSTFKNNKLLDVKMGKIVPIPPKVLNSEHFSGINNHYIWIHKSKLKKPTMNLKFPRKYKNLF